MITKSTCICGATIRPITVNPNGRIWVNDETGRIYCYPSSYSRLKPLIAELRANGGSAALELASDLERMHRPRRAA